MLHAMNEKLAITAITLIALTILGMWMVGPITLDGVYRLTRLLLQPTVLTLRPISRRADNYSYRYGYTGAHRP
jgi:hypothetical protein